MKELLYSILVITFISCQNFGEPIGEKRVAESPGFMQLTFYNKDNCILTIGGPFTNSDYNLKYKLSSKVGGTVWIKSDQSLFYLENHTVKINNYKYIIIREK